MAYIYIYACVIYVTTVYANPRYGHYLYCFGHNKTGSIPVRCISLSVGYLKYSALQGGGNNEATDLISKEFKIMTLQQLKNKVSQVMGQTADLLDLQRLLMRSKTRITDAQQQSTTRWAVYTAAQLLRKYPAE